MNCSLHFYRLTLLLVCCLLPPCGSGDRSPVGTVKQFIKYSARNNTEKKMFKLLASVSRKRLEQAARQASDHIGGSSQLQPEEMLMVGLSTPPSMVSKITLQRKRGQRAWVQISDSKGKQNEVWELLEEQGRWRVILPLK